MRVLVTGAGGQLGRELARHCAAAGDDVVALDRAQLDVGDRRAVAQALGTHQPEVVVNAAAWTAVDACEGDPERAFRDNADAVRWLREACDGAGAHLVQVSTDYVFDGTLDRPYREDDAPNPLSVYGRSKLAGELAAGDAATIVRTSWLCGAIGGNMVKTVLRLAKERDELSFVEPKTKDMVSVIKHVGCDGGSLLVTTAGYDSKVYRSARNLAGVAIAPASEINAYSVLRSRRVLVTKAALDALVASAKSHVGAGENGDAPAKPARTKRVTTKTAAAPRKRAPKKKAVE